MGKILILLDCPSRIDDISGKPLVDNAGREFIKCLHQAGINYSECIVHYVCKHHIPEPRQKTKKKLRFYTKFTKLTQVLKPEVEQYIEDLHHIIGIEAPTVILACGELSLNILTGEQSITKFRGSILPTTPEWYGTKVVPTYTPAELQTMFEWRFLAITDMKRALYESTFEGIKAPAWEFIVKPSFDQVEQTLVRLLDMAANGTDVARTGLLPDIGSNGWLEFSTGKTAHINSSPFIPTASPTNKVLMTTDVETRMGYIACIGIAWSPVNAICIPMLQVGDSIHYWTLEEQQKILLLIHKLFRHDNIEWGLQNGVYDYQYFAKEWGFIPKHRVDTMVQHHTVWSGLKKSLDFQSSLKLRYHRFWKDDGKQYHNNIKSPHEEQQYWTYNCKDCIATFELVCYNNIELIKYDQVEQYKFQMRQEWVSFKMILRGVRADLQYKNKLAIELLDAIGERTAKLHKWVGFDLNIQSPKQMTEFFYKTLGQRINLNKYSQNPTAANDALEKIKTREPVLTPVIQVIQELRSLNVFLSTFIKAPPSEDKRFRSSYSVAGTGTFRWSSRKDAFDQGLNLQNIPKGTER